MKIQQIFLAIWLCHSMQAATITGVLINATRDSSIVPSETIHLLAMTARSHLPSYIDETTTGSRGQFRFNIADVESSSTYFAAVDHDEVRYFSDGVKLSAKAAVDISLAIYDSTHSTADVYSLMHHVIINDLGDRVRFREIRVLRNPTPKTITHVFLEEHIGAALFQFHLPAGAVNFTPQSDIELLQHRHYVIDRGVFLPGNRTISFSYEIAMPQKNLDVVIQATHSAQTFDLFTRGDNIVINSQQLIDKGMFDIRGNLHHRYGATDVVAGADIRFRIRRIGHSNNTPSPVPAIIVTSAILVLSLVVSIVRKEKTSFRKSSKPQRTTSKSRAK